MTDTNSKEDVIKKNENVPLGPLVGPSAILPIATSRPTTQLLAVPPETVKEISSAKDKEKNQRLSQVDSGSNRSSDVARSSSKKVKKIGNFLSKMLSSNTKEEKAAKETAQARVSFTGAVVEDLPDTQPNSNPAPKNDIPIAESIPDKERIEILPVLPKVENVVENEKAVVDLASPLPPTEKRPPPPPPRQLSMRLHTNMIAVPDQTSPVSSPTSKSEGKKKFEFVIEQIKEVEQKYESLKIEFEEYKSKNRPIDAQTVLDLQRIVGILEEQVVQQISDSKVQSLQFQKVVPVVDELRVFVKGLDVKGSMYDSRVDTLDTQLKALEQELENLQVQRIQDQELFRKLQFSLDKRENSANLQGKELENLQLQIKNYTETAQTKEAHVIKELNDYKRQLEAQSNTIEKCGKCEELQNEVRMVSKQVQMFSLDLKSIRGIIENQVQEIWKQIKGLQGTNQAIMSVIDELRATATLALPTVLKPAEMSRPNNQTEFDSLYTMQCLDSI